MALSIYLDNNATTWINPGIAEEMRKLEVEGIANPASQHRMGRQALNKIENAKESILNSLGAGCEGRKPAQIVLTSGGTEANNLVMHAMTHQRPGLVILGAMEHPSLLISGESSWQCLNAVRLLPGLYSGTYDLDRLEDWLETIYGGRDQQDRVALISLMLANNETGAINSIGQVCSLAQRYEIPVHCDIVQAAGKIPICLDELGVAAATISAHKLHGPVGIGALLIQGHYQTRPLIVGGGQQLGWRAGTEPVALAVGLSLALELAERDRQSGVYQRVGQLRDHFEQLILSALDFVEVNGQSSCRVPQTSNLAFLGLERQALMMALDMEGIACSAGAACASGSSQPSHTLLAMQLSSDHVNGSLRFSLSRNTTAEQIDQAAERIIRVAQKLKSR